MNITISNIKMFIYNPNLTADLNSSMDASQFFSTVLGQGYRFLLQIVKFQSWNPGLDIFSWKSGHICWKHINGLIFFQIMNVNVKDSSIMKRIGDNRAYRWLIVRYLCFETVLIDWFYSPDFLDLKLGSRTIIALLEAQLSFLTRETDKVI